jgi:hypothetical protein
LILWQRIERFTLGVGLQHAAREDVFAGCLWEGRLSTIVAKRWATTEEPFLRI